MHAIILNSSVQGITAMTRQSILLAVHSPSEFAAVLGNVDMKAHHTSSIKWAAWAARHTTVQCISHSLNMQSLRYQLEPNGC